MSNRLPLSQSAERALARSLREVRGCTLCAADLPLGPNPVLRGRVGARVLIISQAPGTRVHETGMSFNDRSGDRLRDWLGIDRATFYDEDKIAIMPMGFCYPGRLPRGGDRPPSRACAPRWHDRMRAHWPDIGLTLLVGSYAIDYYLRETRRPTMTEIVAAWREFLPDFLPMPHPSWRTTGWERRHLWFGTELLPEVRRRVAKLVAD
jgi:uracil-DNA glycosylase